MIWFPQQPPQQPEPEPETDYEGVPDLVYLWRYEELLEAGAPPEVALVIADSDADLHQACDMLRAGCDPQLAQFIVT